EEERFQFGFEAAEAGGEFGPAELGHDDVGHEEVDAGAVAVGEFERLAPVPGFEDSIVLVFEDRACEKPQRRLVFGDQDRSSSGPVSMRILPPSGIASRAFTTRFTITCSSCSRSALTGSTAVGR